MIYTLLTHLPHLAWYINPVMIVCGALLYSVCTLVFHILFPHRPVQLSMIQAYRSLASYMMVKAQFFDPDEADFLDDKNVKLAMKNSKVISAFNQCRSTLFYRLRNQYRHPTTVRMLQYYLIAQNIHERISSSHVDYQEFAHRLQHSDLIYRIGRMIVLQANACNQMADAMYTQQNFVVDKSLQRAGKGLQQALNRYLHQPQQLAKASSGLELSDGASSSSIPVASDEQSPQQDEVNQLDIDSTAALHQHSLQQLVANILAINEQLQRIENIKFSDLQDTANRSIAGQDVESLSEVVQIIRRNLTLNSSVFRHALRMALITAMSCLLVETLDLHFGYWILLTAVLVCQPNYSATTSRLQQRILGTVLGVVVGSLLGYMQLSVVSQLVLIVMSTTLFFVFRTARYSFSTFFITIQVLLGFALIGIDTHVAMYSRILDTIIGCGMAWFAVTYIWADWHYLTLSKTGRKAIQADASYLQQVLQQFRQGHADHVTYRTARRQAHEKATSLSNTVSDMSIEPKKYADKLPNGFQLLQLNYSLISSISALGALREQVENQIETHSLQSRSPADFTSSDGSDNAQFFSHFFALGEKMVALMQQMDNGQWTKLEKSITDIGQDITELQQHTEQLTLASALPTSQKHDQQQTQLILCTQLRRINERLLPYAKTLYSCQ